MDDKKTDILDPETLKDQEGLSGDQQEALEEKLEREAWGEKEEIKKETDKEEEEENESGEDEKKDSEEDTPKEDEEEKPKAELTDEEKAEAFTQEVKAYAESEKMSEEDAKEELLGQQKIVEKYDSDPKKLSKAYRNLQKMYSEADQKAKKLEEEAKIPKPGEGQVRHPFKKDDSGNPVIIDKKDLDAEMVDVYRKEYPRNTEEKDDEEVLEMAIRDIRARHDSLKKEHGENLKIDATAKKEKLLASLPESDKVFVDDVKSILEHTPDNVIMQDRYDVNDVVLWAKGKNFDVKLKEAEEKGFARGKEEAKILGEKESSPDGKGKGSSGKKKSFSIASLSDEEKTRALDMFDSAIGATDEEKYEMFINFKKEK